MIIGELRIYKEEKLGSGMFGYVFRGQLQDRQCAVKVLHEVGTELTLNLSTTSGKRGKVQEERLKSFERERECLLGLRHPNIVELFDIFPYPVYQQQDLPCLVMELLDCSLRHYLREDSDDLPLIYQIRLNLDIANALAYLHKNKMIHRDLCGDNVLISKGDGESIVAKIGDFGMSRIMDTQAMTHSFSVLGHRSGYLPPEGLSKDYDLSLDIFMFGVVMVQIVHAIPDVRSQEERNELIKEVVDDHPLKKFIDRCVVDSKSERPTADKLCNELQNLLGAHTASPNVNVTERINEANVRDVGALSDLL
jgi:serine/threonine protein kinase